MEAFHRFRRLNWRQNPSGLLTPGEFMVLSCIRREVAPGDAGLKVSEIGHHLSVASPTITQHINDMEARGLVTRSADDADRRAVRVALTPDGELTLEKVGALFAARITGLVEYLGEERSDELAGLLTDTYTYF